ncbi:unnamed protein product [Paramecium octaurelia]|uniref:Uncharacterized protein n=1 Tax=Paramecium octaurelia TaxID=43137 RepID=A0A8S1SNE9_PAROT|nr:unnamed protein product [Paramecium octaurelia]
MQQTIPIESVRALQIQKVRKLFPFALNETCITYQSIADLYTFMMEYEYDENIQKLRNRLYLLFNVFYRIIEQLIKIYQIVKITRLNVKHILVDIQREDSLRIHFINLHEKDNLISFDENLQEISQMCMDILKNHQNQMMKKINDMPDHKSNEESNGYEENQLIKEIQYATILSNQFLELLKGPMNFKDVLKFLVQNKIELSFNSPLQYIHEEERTAIQFDEY